MKTKASFNKALLFNSDLTTKLNLIKEILEYTENNLIIHGSVWTRHDFIRLCRCILDAKQIFKTSNITDYPDLLGFNSRASIIKHLKRIHQNSALSAVFPLLRMVYLPDGKLPD